MRIDGPEGGKYIGEMRRSSKDIERKIAQEGEKGGKRMVIAGEAECRCRFETGGDDLLKRMNRCRVEEEEMRGAMQVE